MDQTKAGPKDVFLHILSIIFLYTAVGSFISLVFTYLNVKMPDPLETNHYYISSLYSSIRWAISVLVIVFPAYLWSVWFLNRAYAVSPEKRELKSRRWLIYLTISIAALIIIGDLIALVYNFLQGEFTLRFLFKVLTIFAVAGAVFVYYLWDVRRLAASPRPWFIQAVMYGSIVLAVVAIVAGFLVVGSPKEERAYRFDEERVGNLQMIQSEIVFFWQSKQKLPKDLSELNDSVRGFAVPVDPENSSNYIYKKTGNLSFDLCADFARVSRGGETSRAFEPMPIKPGAYPYDSANYWNHGTGQVCFSRTIDPELYPPFSKTR